MSKICQENVALKSDHFEVKMNTKLRFKKGCEEMENFNIYISPLE
jgi:hypothetical protein